MALPTGSPGSLAGLPGARVAQLLGLRSGRLPGWLQAWLAGFGFGLGFGWLRFGFRLDFGLISVGFWLRLDLA